MKFTPLVIENPEFVVGIEGQALLLALLFNMPPTKLIGEERTTALQEIPEWSEVHGRDAIQRKFQFQDFKQAWSWMCKIADIADKVWTAFESLLIKKAGPSSRMVQRV